MKEVGGKKIYFKGRLTLRIGFDFDIDGSMTSSDSKRTKTYAHH